MRQAEESARAGRFDEALGLANKPGVADHRQALLLRNRLAQELVGRAERRARADDVKGAIGDLDLAEQAGAAPDVLAAARLSVADRVAPEVAILLDAGDPGRALERIDELARHKVSGPAIRRCREAAEAWKNALDEARRGEFSIAHEHLDRAGRLAGDTAGAAIQAAHREVDNRQKSANPRVEALYTALGKGAWPEVLGAAEAVLEVVSDHPAARQARTRAWRRSPPSARPPPRPTAAIGPKAAANPPRNGEIVFLDDEPVARKGGWANSPRPQAAADSRCPLCRGPMAVRQGVHGAFLGCKSYPRCRGTAPIALAPTPAKGEFLHIADDRVAARPLPPPNPGPNGRFLLWADGIGGYLVALDSQITIGRAGPEGTADIQILGDLSRHHATLTRDGDSYILKAHQATHVNNKKVEMVSLRDGDVIRFGPSVEVEFRQPSPVSSTARLRLLSRHRLPMAVEGIVLMAETCILGPSPQAHLPATNLDTPVVLYRQGDALWCRASGRFEIDGKPATARGPITLRSSVLGEGFSFSLEPIGAAGPEKNA
ncbi:MAG: topoisomerase DNA-binding C4 zinc finger domain-containing protein [Isosphaeraceae bacterium]